MDDKNKPSFDLQKTLEKINNNPELKEKLLNHDFTKHKVKHFWEIDQEDVLDVEKYIPKKHFLERFSSNNIATFALISLLVSIAALFISVFSYFFPRETITTFVYPLIYLLDFLNHL